MYITTLLWYSIFFASLKFFVFVITTTLDDRFQLLIFFAIFASFCPKVSADDRLKSVSIERYLLRVRKKEMLYMTGRKSSLLNRVEFCYENWSSSLVAIKMFARRYFCSSSRPPISESTDLFLRLPLSNTSTRPQAMSAQCEGI